MQEHLSNSKNYCIGYMSEKYYYFLDFTKPVAAGKSKQVTNITTQTMKSFIVAGISFVSTEK